MEKTNALKDSVITAIVFCVCCAMGLIMKNIIKVNSSVPSIFALGVFVTSVVTHGYVYGIVSAIISVLAVNFAFTIPYNAFSLALPENIVSTAILLAVTVVTCSLTTKVKKQESLKAERDKERMSANLLRAISHDLRTPLTTIYGSSCALIDNYNEFSHQQKKKILEGIKEDSLWLSRMVENLLSITRLDEAKVEIIKVDTVLDELIDSILVKFAKRYPHWQVEVDIPDEFVVIPMDALLIEQVAINILENAVQHAEGMTRLTMRVYTSKGKAIFEIRDDGCGIPEEKLKKIFTEAQLGDRIVSDGRRKNAGIGLSVCASIIKAHGGQIRAENLKGGGSMFRFALHMGENGDE